MHPPTISTVFVMLNCCSTAALIPVAQREWWETNYLDRFGHKEGRCLRWLFYDNIFYLCFSKTRCRTGAWWVHVCFTKKFFWYYYYFFQNVNSYCVKNMKYSEQRARGNSDCPLVSRDLNSSSSHYFFLVYQGWKLNHLSLLRCILHWEFCLTVGQKERLKKKGEDKTREAARGKKLEWKTRKNRRFEQGRKHNISFQHTVSLY